MTGLVLLAQVALTIGTGFYAPATMRVADDVWQTGAVAATAGVQVGPVEALGYLSPPTVRWRYLARAYDVEGWVGGALLRVPIDLGSPGPRAPDAQCPACSATAEPRYYLVPAVGHQWRRYGAYLGWPVYRADGLSAGVGLGCWSDRWRVELLPLVTRLEAGAAVDLLLLLGLQP